jgi:glycerophosphoryl diester phosphodiesterase
MTLPAEQNNKPARQNVIKQTTVKRKENNMNRIISSLVLLALTTAAAAQTKIVAHRGHWNTEGSAQNSITSLHKAAEAGCWGSEFDVWITADGVCVINHDATVNGTRIETADYSQLRSMRLANGETLPTLEQYLWEGAHLSPIRLVLEIKGHSTPEAESKCVDEVLRLVKKYGVVDQTDYISFSIHVCEDIVAKAHKVLDGPNGQRSGKKEDKVDLCVEYLGGDLTPQEVKAKGLTGIDYEQSVLLEKHPEWIEECHNLGLKVNVWTVDSLDNVWKLITNKADKITTNRPVESLKLSK